MTTENLIQLPWNYRVYQRLAFLASIPPIVATSLCFWSPTCGDLFRKGLSFLMLLFMAWFVLRVGYTSHRIGRGSKRNTSSLTMVQFTPEIPSKTIHYRLLVTILWGEFYGLFVPLQGLTLWVENPVIPWIGVALILLILGVLIPYNYKAFKDLPKPAQQPTALEPEPPLNPKIFLIIIPLAFFLISIIALGFLRGFSFTNPPPEIFMIPILFSIPFIAMLIGLAAGTLIQRFFTK